jgi:hypothetical protein
MDTEFLFHEDKLSKEEEGRRVNTFLLTFVLAQSNLILISKFFRRSCNTMRNNNETYFLLYHDYLHNESMKETSS